MPSPATAAGSSALWTTLCFPPGERGFAHQTHQHLTSITKHGLGNSSLYSHKLTKPFGWVAPLKISSRKTSKPKKSNNKPFYKPLMPAEVNLSYHPKAFP